MTETLEKTEEQRRRFVSDASHELKTPLAAIRLLADSITETEDIDPGTVREFVRGHLQRGRKAPAHDGQAARTSPAATTARGASASPSTWASRPPGTLRLLAPLADKTGVALRCEADAGCVVSAPEDDVYQIIFNLAENAVKYNVPGGDVFVSVRREGGRVAAHGRGHGHRHTGEGPPEHLLALLPRGQGPLARARRQRPRPLDSPRRRRRPGRGASRSVGAREGGGTRFTRRASPRRQRRLLAT